MKVLMDCGLVECNKKGTWNYYKLSSKKCIELIESLKQLFCDNNKKNVKEPICKEE